MIRRTLQLAEILEFSISGIGDGVQMGTGVLWMRAQRLPVFLVGEVDGWRVSLRHRRKCLKFTSGSVSVKHGCFFGCSLTFAGIGAI